MPGSKPDKSQGKYRRYFAYGLIVLNLLSLALAVFRIADARILIGDEHFYHRELMKMIDVGIYEALAEGTSTMLEVPAYFLYKLGFPTVLSLKLVSFICLPLFLLGIYLFLRTVFNARSEIILLGILTAFQFLLGTKTFILFINDGLMATFLLYSIYYLSKTKPEGGVFYYVIAGILFGLSFGVRLIALFYLTGILVYFSMQLMRKKPGILRGGSFFLLSLFVTTSVIQWPALARHHTLEFEKKLPIKRVVDGFTCNWTQLQYLSQLKVEEGKLGNYNHVDFAELEQYLIDNGINSLPRTLWEQIIWNPWRTLREFIHDLLIDSGYIMIRTTGFLIFLALLLWWNILFKKENYPEFDGVLLLSLVGFVLMLTISFIIITYIESRWYTLSIGFVIILGSYFLEWNFRRQSPWGPRLIRAQLIYILLSTGLYLRPVLSWLQHR